MSKKVILTGLRANSDLHIGHIFGALLPIIDMAKTKSDEFQINLFVPDLHSFTTPIDHGVLKSQIKHNLKLFIAAGLPLDNPSVHIYRQSYVPAHSELTLILNSFTGMGEMERMTQFKDKSSKLNSDRISVGLFDYPVLMASDILLYGASYVPVGDDQSQHLEFTRDIAQRMNNRFGNLFTIPEEVKKQHEFFGKDQGLRIMDLVDPSKKMSKSDETGKGVIFLTDSVEVSAKKIMSSTTDSIGVINYDKDSQPGICNLLELLALLNMDNLEAVIERYAGQTSYGALKTETSEALAGYLTDFQARLEQVDEQVLEAKLAASEAIMNESANQTLLAVQKAIGIR